jgi:hypothetical protein
MECENGHKVLVSRLKPLPGESQISYLVALDFKKPKTCFGWPMFMIRTTFTKFAKIPQNEVEQITWFEERSGWNVKLANGGISELSTKDAFVELKYKYYQDIK